MKIDIKEGLLFVDDKEVAGFSSKNLEFVASLGKGANGYTFLVRHKVLNINQVVKIYKSSDSLALEKALQESKKNSEPLLKDVIARVYDAGIVNIGTEEKVYSVMDFIGSTLTLKQWLRCRNYAYDYIKNDKEHPGRLEFLEQYFIQEALNISVSFLSSVSKFLKNNITHGDMNENNVFINSNFYSLEIFDRIERNEIVIFDNSIRSYYVPGTVDSRNKPVLFIDLGTSQIEGTDASIGNIRDAYYIFDSLKKILSPLFRKARNKSLNHFVNLDANLVKVVVKDIPNHDGELINAEMIASELLRFLLFTNLSLNFSTIDHRDLRELNIIMFIGGAVTRISDIDSKVFDITAQEAYEYYVGSRYQRNGSLIKWEEYIDYLKNVYNKRCLGNLSINYDKYPDVLQFRKID